jgi:hypothetical protein
MKKKRKVALPRITMLAMDRREPLAFVEAVSALRILVQDIRIVVDSLEQATASRRRRAPAESQGEKS